MLMGKARLVEQSTAKGTPLAFEKLKSTAFTDLFIESTKGILAKTWPLLAANMVSEAYVTEMAWLPGCNRFVIEALPLLSSGTWARKLE